MSAPAAARDEADVAAAEVAGHHPDGAAAVLGATDRGAAVSAMAEALTRFLATRDDVGAVLGLGGSGNTALVTPAMRALPIGAAEADGLDRRLRQCRGLCRAGDIAMMYSVTDIAGLNAISRG